MRTGSNWIGQLSCQVPKKHNPFISKASSRKVSQRFTLKYMYIVSCRRHSSCFGAGVVANLLSIIIHVITKLRF